MSRTHTPRLRRLVAVLVLAGAVPACGTATSPAPPSEAPTTTVQRPRIVDKSDRPWVTFDPCVDIPDDTFARAGYDPESKDPGEFAATDYTFLICRLTEDGETIPHVRRKFLLSILAGNVTLEEELAKNPHSRRTAIAGRDALVDDAVQQSCTITVRADFGLVFFSRGYNPEYRAPNTPELWCRGFQDTVEHFLPHVP